MENTNQSIETSTQNEPQNVNLVQSIIKFNCNDYNEEEDTDYQPDPEVEEEIIQEYQTEAEQLIADKVYHEFVDNLNASQNVDNLEDTADDNDFVAESEDEQPKLDEEKQEQNESMNSAVYDSTCTETEFETDLEEENVKSQIDGEEINLLSQQVPVKVPISSLAANQTAYPPFWRVKHALQNVDSEQEADTETDPDFNPLSNDTENGEASKQEDPQAEVEARSLQLRHRTVQVKGGASSDISDSSSESEGEDDEEDDEELKAEINKLKELEDLSQQVKGMVDMVEEMSFVDGSQDQDPSAEKNFCGFRFVDTGNSQNILGISNHFQNRKFAQPATIVDAIEKFDDQAYQEDEDADYYPNENKENEVCMQEC